MPDYTVRPMELEQLQRIYQHIVQDFPAGEYPPCDILYRHLQSGTQDAQVFCAGEQVLAYSICAAGSDYVLISLLAVLPEFRGQGVGSAFLPALIKSYSGKQGIIIEVERPELAAGPEETRFRQWRLGFYKKAGFYLLEGIDYSIWDMPMHLMALPLLSSRQTIDENIDQIMRQIYLRLMGKRFMHKLVLKKK